MPLGESFATTLEAARLGAEWAWDALYEDLAPAVTGYLRARGTPEPEDLTGEVFLQIVRDLRGFNGGERDFRAWVFTIAHHRLLDDLRYRQRRPVEPAEHPEIGEGVPGPEESALASVAVERIRAALGRLSPDQRDVLLLRLFGRLTVAEVALVVGKREGAVKALQRRGLASLRRHLLKEGVTL
jgi:RNA polymerase sigma factor (sigma-70 family)